MPYSDATLQEKYGDQLENLGANLKGCKLGLVVPSYVTINSIAEMNTSSDKFNRKIFSLQRRTSVAQLTGDVLKEYNINEYTIVYNDEEALLKVLDKSKWYG